MPKNPEFSGRDMTELLDSIEPRLRRRFLEMIDAIRAELSIEALATLIREGRLEEAVDIYERASTIFARDLTEAFTDSGKSTGAFVSDALDILVGYDQFDPRAVEYAASNELDVVREFTEEQRDVTRRVIAEGVARGTNPIEQAREIREAIGLTERQEAAVQAYREQLENGSSQALDRALRDRRFDSTVQTSIDSGKPLSKTQIDKMVTRYRERYLKYRSEVIARTEALRAVNAGSEEMFRQVIESGDIRHDQVERSWHTADDERVRDAHREMRVAVVGIGEPFVDGDGNELMFPGDPAAPPETTIQCRCVVATRLLLTPRPQVPDEATEKVSLTA